MSLLIQLHDLVTTRVSRPAFQIGRSMVPRHWGTYRAFRAGMKFRIEAASWTFDQREAWLLGRLRQTLRYAYDTTPYYRQLWERIGFDPRAEFGWDDFARLPVLTRGDLHAHGRELRSSAVPDWNVERNATGGSTGRPVEIWMGPEERGWRASGAEYSMRLLGVGEGVRRALLWGHSLAPTVGASIRDRAEVVLANRGWFDCLRLSPEILRAYDRRLRRFRPRVVVAYASALAALAREVERAGGPPPNYPTRCFVTGAEKLFDDQRELIERVFGRTVYERYGSRDVGDIAFQYRRDASLTLDVDWPLVLVEPQAADRESPILVTKLHGDGMPMIRYVNDDVALFPAGAVPGRPVFRLETIVGRIADRVILPNGRWLHGIHFPHLLKDYPIRDFQIHQAANFALTVRLAPLATFSASHREAIEHNIRANLPGLPISFEVLEEIPRTGAGKWRPVVSEVQS
ncbi:MAG TPA: hypothetical protein VEI47_09220 [Gemmatimonadales bacterium]|nr:hypothetical protein [Gemmatimonadales bacterium]